MKLLRGFFTTVTLVVLLAPHTGCDKKDASVLCYECQMTYDTGQPAGTQYPCSADIAAWQKEQKDNNGRLITSECRER